jgi:hypothetical protein
MDSDRCYPTTGTCEPLVGARGNSSLSSSTGTARTTPSVTVQNMAKVSAQKEAQLNSMKAEVNASYPQRVNPPPFKNSTTLEANLRPGTKDSDKAANLRKDQAIKPATDPPARTTGPEEGTIITINYNSRSTRGNSTVGVITAVTTGIKTVVSDIMTVETAGDMTATTAATLNTVAEVTARKVAIEETVEAAKDQGQVQERPSLLDPSVEATALTPRRRRAQTSQGRHQMLTNQGTSSSLEGPSICNTSCLNNNRRSSHSRCNGPANHMVGIQPQQEGHSFLFTTG